MLLVTALMLIFVQIDDIKKVLVRVLTFYVGLTLFVMLWNLIVDGYSTFYASLQGIENVINGYLDEPLDMQTLYTKVLTPIKGIIGVLDLIVKYLVTFAKFGFIISLFANKKGSNNVLSKFIDKYIDKAVIFTNNVEKEK